MIGLTTSLAAIAGYEQAAGYAIPVDDVFRQALETLKDGREVGVGLSGRCSRQTSRRRTERAGLQRRAYQAMSRRNAGRSGGPGGQDIITHVDGEPVHDADALDLACRRSGRWKPRVRVTVLRDNRPQKIDVELGKAHVPGAEIVTATPALARHSRRLLDCGAVRGDAPRSAHGSCCAMAAC